MNYVISDLQCEHCGKPAVFTICRSKGPVTYACSIEHLLCSLYEHQIGPLRCTLYLDKRIRIEGWLYVDDVELTIYKEKKGGIKLANIPLEWVKKVKADFYCIDLVAESPQ